MMSFVVNLSPCLTCGKHNKVCEEPYILACEHLLCKTTVNQLKDKKVKTLTCPTCGRRCSVGEINDSFKLGRFAFFHLHEQRSLIKNKTQDVMDLKKKPADGQDLLIRFTKDSDVEGYIHIKPDDKYSHGTLEEEMQNNIGKILYKIVQLRKASRCYSDFVHALQARKAAIQKAYNTTRHKLKVMRMQATESADKAEYNRLMFDLNETVEDEMDGLIQFYTDLKGARERFAREKSMLKGLVQDNDCRELLGSGLISYLLVKTEDFILSFLDKLKALPELDHVYRLEIVSNDDDFDVNHPEKLEVVVRGKTERPTHESWDRQEQEAQAEANQRTEAPNKMKLSKRHKLRSRARSKKQPKIEKKQFLLEDYTNAEIKMKLLCQFKVEPHKMALVGDEIWMLMFQEDAIVIMAYDSAAETVKMSRCIHVHETVEKRAIFRKTQNIEVRYGVNAIENSLFGTICACWCGTEQRRDVTRRDIGLVIIDREGLIKETITSGKYCDVKADIDLVYGFELLELKITVHMKQPQAGGLRTSTDSARWQLIREIAFKEEFFRMTLYFDSIFLSGPKLRAILELQLDTDQKIKHSIAYKATKYDSYWPHVSAVDEVGNVLICDEKNGRLAVLMYDDTWRLLHIKQKIRPCDAIRDRDNNLLTLNFDTKSIDKLVIGKTLTSEERALLSSEGEQEGGDD